MIASVLQLSPPFVQRWHERIQQSPIGYRLARGAFWSLAGAVISRGLGLLAVMVVGHVLGTDGFGDFTIIQSTIGTFAVFAGFSMGLTAARHVAEYRFRDPARAGRIIGLSSLIAWGTGLAMTLTLIGLAPWIAALQLDNPELAVPLCIGAPLLLLGGVSGAQTGALNGFEAFKRGSLINLICGVASFPILVVFVWFWGLPGAIWALVVTQAFNVILNHYGLAAEARQDGVPLGWRGAMRERAVVWRFSLPAVLSGAMVAPVLLVAQSLFYIGPQGKAEMGVYGAANNWRNVIVFIPSMLAGVALPMLSSLRGPADARAYQSLLWSNVKLSLWSSLAVALPVALVSPYIMRGFGRGFAEGYWVLIILCAVTVISSTLSVIGQSIASEGRMWFGLLLNGIWGVVLLGVSWLLRDRGALGFSWANLAAYSVHLITVSVYVRYRLKKGVETSRG